jgi:hypothetical protein
MAAARPGGDRRSGRGRAAHPGPGGSAPLLPALLRQLGSGDLRSGAALLALAMSGAAMATTIPGYVTKAVADTTRPAAAPISSCRSS